MKGFDVPKKCPCYEPERWLLGWPDHVCSTRAHTVSGLSPTSLPLLPRSYTQGPEVLSALVHRTPQGITLLGLSRQCSDHFPKNLCSKQLWLASPFHSPGVERLSTYSLHQQTGVITIKEHEAEAKTFARLRETNCTEKNHPRLPGCCAAALVIVLRDPIFLFFLWQMSHC